MQISKINSQTAIMNNRPKTQKQMPRRAVSFKGTGEVITRYHLFSEKLPEKALLQLKKVVASYIEKSYPEGSGIKIQGGAMSFPFLKEKVLQMGLLNKKNELTCIRPKTIIIKKGEMEIPDTFDADKILQKGGRIEGILNADRIFISGGENCGMNAEEKVWLFGTPKIHGDISTKNFTAYDAEIKNNTRVLGELFLYGNTKILKNVDVDVVHVGSCNSGSAHLFGNAEVHGNLNIDYTLFMHSDSAKIMKGATAKAYYAQLRKGSILGKLSVEDTISVWPEDFKILGEVSVGEVVVKADSNGKATRDEWWRGD